MVMMAKLDLPSRFIRQQMASVVHLLVQTARMSDGTRRVTHVSEVTGLNDFNILVRDIFVFEQTAVAQDGRVLGRFRGTGASPHFSERLRVSGLPLPPKLFEEVVAIG
jgi:pilus assembly protein CpaF